MAIDAYDDVCRSQEMPGGRRYTRGPVELSQRTFAGRSVACIGLGACAERGDEDPQVSVCAIATGCNVLDTAPHYHAGAHERCIGEAVRIAVAEEICEREALIVTSKVGVVPDLLVNTPPALGFARFKSFVEERFVHRDLFKWQDLAAGIHTLAPGFIRYSIQRSLEQIGLSYLDCVFLESPMIQLRCVDRAEFRRRLIAAFATLEGLCNAGVIRCYGISTEQPLDLKDFIDAAETVAPSVSHLRALRLPFSLLRPDFAPLIHEAADQGLYVFAARVLDGGTPQYQLPDDIAAQIGQASDASVAIQWVRSAPNVGTVLFGSRDSRHVRANLAAACLPPLDVAYYPSSEQTR